MTITFHGPFRIATGRGRPGINAVVDPDDLLPASSLKGLMRDSAERLLPAAPGLVTAVFGGPQHPGAWGWDPVEFTGGAGSGPVVVTRAHVALDEETGTARHDHLRYAEEVWARTAEFSVTQYAPLPGTDGPALTVADHRTVLACAAAGVHALGAGRRRGLGWVRFTPEEPTVDEALLARFGTLAEQWRNPRA
ncbi:RAMP superfamily CRISPR-associated protein [Streptomyces sp. NPDC002454]